MGIHLDKLLNLGEIFKNVFRIKDHSHTKILPERDLTRYCTTVLQHGKGTYSATITEPVKRFEVLTVSVSTLMKTLKW